MGATLTQLFPPAPTLTEKNLPNQKGKVFIVTGGYAGVGYYLSLILYRAGAKVYLAGRSEAKAESAILALKAAVPDTESPGELKFLQLNLEDLSSIKASAQAFTKQESKLHVLWNNAGVSQPPSGSKSKQGHELTFSVNVLGHLLFSQLLIPSLEAAAASSPGGSVRVIWTSSQVVDFMTPKGTAMLDQTKHSTNDATKDYVNSKTGNWFIASEFSHYVAPKGVLSITQNPGNLRTNLLRNAPWIRRMCWPLLHPGPMGAYTELWAGLSEELTMDDGGCYVIPWGSKHPSPRKDLLDALKSTEDGGSGLAKAYWDYCWDQIKGFL